MPLHRFGIQRAENQIARNKAVQGHRTPKTYAILTRPIGSRRIRFPVAAKIAFAIAGATGGTPGSPTPVGGSLLGMM